MLEGMAGELERGPGPGALPDPDSVVIPDDASALEADMWALRAELKARQRAERRRPPGPSPSSSVISRIAPMLFGGLMLVAFLSGLAGIVGNTAPQPAAPTALAETSDPDGTVGGLLPPAIVEVDTATMSLRSVRPAVLVWVPAEGMSPVLLDSLYLQATSYGMPLVLAGPPERVDTLADEARRTSPSGRVSVLLDPASAVLDSLDLAPTAGPVVVVVGVDGRIHAVVENPADGVRLESVLTRAVEGGDPR
jgi:hypothetical protein